ncbi:MAG: molybdopterin-synthase adenylyltransferase MoeB [Halorhodospira halophila]|uniref:molybdopterin-synthase adenylyltransferase MoeB n=1 Tax=Halorhodospira TaxID=85108 RepID=UPI0019130301|nr:molybdopterin-synthase adenylyltransferase MoeB [Halorhodospira halophila]MCG5533166.1 molybdopterin-synthase adenylyltransferase MoeB [Halorhodospira sp. 9621]MCG5537920.1 molybdopterin-synthase adenylyltransferase MoeB [Halorhodospira sp. 9622]MCG5542755.1 molybdopterin-synthase adenylyltransferase MoeB [Halorhodospira sp. 9628]MBK5943378.1 molybdopterin-synthase adenylyltransferase MoeB [Halorhodospira halophila]MCC3751048.1 molybdopterin-synthase adenylyltransferase MoeB [Halorhodospira
MNDEQLLRYSRQIMLPELDIAGQQRLAGSRALIVGAGGLGSPLALYLGAAGVGELRIADDDTVDLSNLQRQIAHRHDAIGQPKATSAARAVAARNPEITLSPLQEHLEGGRLSAEVAAADVVIDATDNFATRFALNAACVAAQRPLVSAAVIRWELQVTAFRPGGRPCYRCIYAEGDEPQLTCSESGVLGPLPGVAGTLEAVEAIKILSGAGDPLFGRLLLIDALRMRLRTLTVNADPHCPVCADAA